MRSRTPASSRRIYLSVCERPETLGRMVRFLLAFALFFAAAGEPNADPDTWKAEWPKTDFSRRSVPFDEILSGGPPKDGIPAIDSPQFRTTAEITDLADTEPVVSLHVGDRFRAYPLRILIWHEIVNDTIAGVPVAVTFCPLCNAAIVFDRRVDGKTLDFGTTGKLRNSDLVMYDRQTESWWQQFLGDGIVGTMTGKTLDILPARLESWADFKRRAPGGQVLVPNAAGMRPYGGNPYSGYDSLPRPFLFSGKMPEGIRPLARVVSLRERNQAWSLALLRRKREIRLDDGSVIRWSPGQNSALDKASIAEGKDVGTVTVLRETPTGAQHIPYFVDFAFAFHAFRPRAPIHK